MKVKEWMLHPIYTSYTVSSCGNVHHIKKTKNLNKYITHKGYETVYVYLEGVRYGRMIHRLMMEAFHPTKDTSLQVNHKDGVKTHNDLCNLEWCTASENVVHAFDMGLNTRNKRVYIYNIKNGEYVGEFLSSVRAANALGVPSSKIRENCRGVRNRCGDYFASRTCFPVLPKCYLTNRKSWKVHAKEMAGLVQ